jgi:predicted Zn-dependent protease
MRTLTSATLTPIAFTLLLAAAPNPGQAQDVPEFQPEAVRAFADGFEAYIRTDYREAITHFYRAYEIDPNFVAALFEAAVNHSNLQEPEKADSLLEIVGRSLDHLSPYYQHRVRAVQANLDGDRELSYRESKKAAELAPGTKAVYNQAYYGMLAHYPRDAREALLTLDPEQPPMKGWFPYWNMLTWAEHELGNHEAQLAATRRAGDQYPGDIRPVLLEAEALAALGRVEELKDLLDRVSSVESRGTLTPGVVMTNAAADLDAHGYKSASGPVYAKALDWYDGRPDSVAEGESHRNGHAWTLYHAGKLEEARDMYQLLISDYPDNILYHGTLGAISAALGDGREADRQSEWLAGVDNPRDRAGADLWRGYIAAASGQRDRAVELIRQSFEGGQAHFVWMHKDRALDGLRRYGPFEELVRPKG